jgi:hypothetical protein
MLQTLKHTKIFTNLLLIYKWALCQVSFEHLTNIGFLKTLYAGTKSIRAKVSPDRWEWKRIHEIR